jgi:hypothetical protein
MPMTAPFASSCPSRRRRPLASEPRPRDAAAARAGHSVGSFTPSELMPSPGWAGLTALIDRRYWGCERP